MLTIENQNKERFELINFKEFTELERQFIIKNIDNLELRPVYTMINNSGEEHLIKEQGSDEDIEELDENYKDYFIKRIVAKKPYLLTYEQALIQNIACPGSIMFSPNKLHWNSAGLDSTFWPENVFFTSIITEFEI